MAELAIAFLAPEQLEQELHEALAVCGGDAMKALRITLIANAFLEQKLGHLEAEVSSGYARRRRKVPNKSSQPHSPTMSRPFRETEDGSMDNV